jgi:hypothetical protein
MPNLREQILKGMRCERNSLKWVMRIEIGIQMEENIERDIAGKSDSSSKFGASPSFTDQLSELCENENEF